MDFDITEHQSIFRQAHSQFIYYIQFTINDIIKRNDPAFAPDIAKLRADYTSVDSDLRTMSAYMAMYIRKPNDDTLHMIILNSVAFSVKCIEIQYYIDTLYNIKKTNCAEDIINMYMTSDTAIKRSIGIFMKMSVLLYNEYRDTFDRVDSDEVDIKSCNEPITGVTENFGGIRGQDTAITDLKIMYILPFKYPNLFMNKSTGVLLYGPPGTGKTLLARASVHEFKRAAFYAPTPGALKGKYIGETEKNIDRVFNCAKHVLSLPDQKDPSIMAYNQSVIFFDEFDSVAGVKSSTDPNMTLSVNALLQQMDGIGTSKEVSVIASTNYPWRLAEAIQRRFTNRILVDLADTDAIRSIILDTLKNVYYTPIIQYTGIDESNDVLEFLKSNDHPECGGTLDPEVYNILKGDTGAAVAQNIYDPYGIQFALEKTGMLMSAQQWYQLKVDAEQKNFCINSELSIEYIVSLFTPDSAGYAIKQSILDKIDYDLSANEDIIDGPNIFGYSPSDIKQIMASAIRSAAYRAAQGPLQKVFFSDDAYIYSPVSRAHANTLTEVYITNDFDYTQPLDSKVTRTIVTDRHAIFNTTLTQHDVLYARNNTPSTIRNRDYINLLKYYIFGTIPNE